MEDHGCRHTEHAGKCCRDEETPPAANKDICFCPLFGILDVIAKKWALLIIAILGNEGEKGFNELKKELGCIAPKPLSDTLKNLERIGLVSKKVMETSPPTVKYSLTSEGRKLREHLIPMLVWVSEHGGQEMPGCPIKTGKHRCPGDATGYLPGLFFRQGSQERAMCYTDRKEYIKFRK